MNINRIGITKVIPKEDFKSLPYKELVDMGCTQIRERFLNDGRRLLMGHNDTQKLANFTQTFTPQGWLEKQAFYNVDTYGPQKELKEISIDKTWYNKIGDILKSKYLVKNYNNNNLTKETKIEFDIIEGIDKSKTRYTRWNTEEKNKDIGLVHKYRISQAEYTEETYNKNGDFMYKDTHIIDDKDGMWKY